MAKNKLQIMADILNENFRIVLPAGFYKKFSLSVNTEYNFFADRLVTMRVDKEDLTIEQREFVEAFEIGYAMAMNQVRVASQET